MVFYSGCLGEFWTVVSGDCQARTELNHQIGFSLCFKVSFQAVSEFSMHSKVNLLVFKKIPGGFFCLTTGGELDCQPSDLQNTAISCIVRQNRVFIAFDL